LRRERKLATNYRDRKSINDAPITGWRYLVQDDQHTIAGVEVAVDPRTSQMRFSQIQSRPVAESTAATIRTAQELDAVRRESFEVRLLRVPALYTVALWLRDRDKKREHHHDLLVPVAPAPSGLESNRAYQARQFFDILYQKARERSDDDPARAAGDPRREGRAVGS
jgi:hypothetical protein